MQQQFDTYKKNIDWFTGENFLLTNYLAFFFVVFHSQLIKLILQFQ